MKFTIKEEEYSAMKEELIKLLNSDNRMNIDEILSLIEKHWGYINIQQYVECKENFFQWEIERLIYNTEEYTMKELVLKQKTVWIIG